MLVKLVDDIRATGIDNALVILQLILVRYLNLVKLFMLLAVFEFLVLTLFNMMISLVK